MDKTFKNRILSIKTPDSVDKIGLTGFRDKHYFRSCSVQLVQGSYLLSADSGNRASTSYFERPRTRRI